MDRIEEDSSTEVDSTKDEDSIREIREIREVKEVTTTEVTEIRTEVNDSIESEMMASEAETEKVISRDGTGAGIKGEGMEGSSLEATMTRDMGTIGEGIEVVLERMEKGIDSEMVRNEDSKTIIKAMEGKVNEVEMVDVSTDLWEIGGIAEVVRVGIVGELRKVTEKTQIMESLDMKMIYMRPREATLTTLP